MNSTVRKNKHGEEVQTTDCVKLVLENLRMKWSLSGHIGVDTETNGRERRKVEAGIN